MRPLTPYDLVNRYLQAVEKHLHQLRQADDVLNELAANLIAQLEDREAELGRALTPEEVGGVLKHHGAPREVADRYWPQRYLIGPALLPVYWRVLKIALYWIVLIDAAVNVAFRATQVGTSAAPLEGLTRIPAAGTWVGALTQIAGTALWVFAWVTLTFAVADHLATRFRKRQGPRERWNPMSLPKLEPSWTWRRGWYAGFELLPGIAAALYWVAAVPRHPVLMFGAGALFLRYAPAVESLFWPVLGLLLVELGLDAVAMAYGPDTWQRRAKAAAAKAVSLGIFLLLLSGRQLVVAAAPAFVRAAQTANAVFLVAVIFAACLAGLSLVFDLGRLAAAMARSAAPES